MNYLKIIIIVIIIIILILSILYVFKSKLFKGGMDPNHKKSHIDQMHMMIIGNHFNNLDDFEKIENVNSKYKDITKKYKQNPIPITDERDRNLFENIETQHIYDNADLVIENDKIKKYVDWTQISFYDYLNNSYANTIYKNVILTRDDAKYYFEDKETIEVPEGITEIGESAISGFNFKHIILPSTLKRINKSAFVWCKSLEEIIIPEDVIEINERAFACCKSLRSVTLPNTLRIIGALAFVNCESLEEIIIPEGVTEIDFAAFKLCTSLRSVTLPSTLKIIHDSVFKGCESLENINIPEGVEIGEGVFEGTPHDLNNA